MDSLVAAAARALASGDPLGALKHVALREDPAALALRGIAMAQLGEHGKARALLRRAARGFGPRERLSRARCQAAEAEVALAARELSAPPRALEQVARTLDALGDRANALHARLVGVRRSLLLGRLDEVDAALAALAQGVAPRSRAAPGGNGATASASAVTQERVPDSIAALYALVRAEVALRRLRVAEGAQALVQAEAAARAARIPALLAEIEHARAALSAPVARLLRGTTVEPISLARVEALLASDALVIDACRRAVRAPGLALSLARRPVLFALARALAESWPGDATRATLISRAFDVRAPNATHRARLRVELGRLRTALQSVASIAATPDGFALVPRSERTVVVLAPPLDGPEGAIRALLHGGEAWSTSALATALGASQRTVQRALGGLESSGAVRALGRGRARRWLAPPLTGFATTLLLPGALPVG